MSKAVKLLHVYGQTCWHDTLRIIGNTTGLTALRDAIGKAIQNGYDYSDNAAMPNDGEYFHIEVLKHKEDWEDWNNIAVPYTDEASREYRKDAKHLEQLKNES
jgi:hypothetical protein